MRPLIPLLLSACSPALVPLAPDAADQLEAAAADPDALGERIYIGDTHDPDGALSFTYERWIRSDGETQTSSHLTRDLDGLPVVLHQATHDAQYGLQRFDEIHAQTGWSGSVTLDTANAEVVFTARHGETLFERAEPLDEPVHTGPTLFGFALAHWDDLAEGAEIPLRFVVLDRQRTYRFQLSQASSDATHTVFELRATSAFVRAAIAPMQLTFDTATRTPVRFEGRVPPVLDGRAFDGRVDYREVAPTFR